MRNVQQEFIFPQNRCSDFNKARYVQKGYKNILESRKKLPVFKQVDDFIRIVSRCSR